MGTTQPMTEWQHDGVTMMGAQLEAVVGGVQFDLSMIIEDRLKSVAFPSVQEVTGVEMPIVGDSWMSTDGEHVLY